MHFEPRRGKYGMLLRLRLRADHIPDRVHGIAPGHVDLFDFVLSESTI